MSSPIKVDVWSDIACPWCFIGKRKFEVGAAEFGGDVEVEYHSFELSPDTPFDFDGSEQEYLVTRGFPAEQIGGMLTRVTGIAESVGLHYDYDALQHSNTEFADLAAELGLERDDVIRSLSVDEYLADVQADQALAIVYGIQGVPFFVIDGKYGVSGAQDAATFASVLTQVRNEKESVE